MFKSILDFVYKLVEFLDPVTTLGITMLLGLFTFWKLASRSRKNNSSIFDIFVVSSVVGIIFSRVSHIISNWPEFSEYIWYWLPYERYAEQIYLFRLLPWRFLRLWDGGVDVLLTVVGMILAQTLIILLVKKWRWSHLFPSIYLSNWLILGISFILIGIQSKNDLWIHQGSYILLPFFLFVFVIWFLPRLYLGKRRETVITVLETIFAIVSAITISYVYFSSDLNIMTRIGLTILLIWYAFGILFYIIDGRRTDNVTIEKVSSVRHMSLPDVGQSIRLRK